MAQDDYASKENVSFFDNGEARILAAASDWPLLEKVYLNAVLSDLRDMTANYSYGNGEIHPAKNELWEGLKDSKYVIDKLNSVIKPSLGIELTDQGFPDTLWFDQLVE